ncbi:MULTISPECIES: hypothetical protein [Bradyrhizobium]|uniref:hypothetical protein n=1 Tax=Bradyrhizobium TaxID=374 RepID=UPI00293E2C71|nr:hypothetical protein [Bradyrhizobium sp. BWC-3-1]WOH56102.1 hypothetical protein RX329_28035 [Bradyrhizobium sp. BWC-3-1]
MILSEKKWPQEIRLSSCGLYFSGKLSAYGMIGVPAEGMIPELAGALTPNMMSLRRHAGVWG